MSDICIAFIVGIIIGIILGFLATALIVAKGVRGSDEDEDD